MRAKDTPNFIANRIGVFQMMLTLRLMERFGLGDGNDLPESIPDPQAILDEDPSVRLGQRHAGAQLPAQDLVLLPQIVVF